MNAYKTIKSETVHEFTEKKSVFISRIKPVKTNAEALEFIASVREKNKDASHNCYAYVIREGGAIRQSDDGEPQSTAGIQILGIIQKNDLSDVAIVVTRYFGGILLGAPGLVKAYSAAAKFAVEKSEIVSYEPFITFKVSCGYKEYQKICKTYEPYNIIVDSENFEDKVIIWAAIAENNYEKYKTTLINAANGACGVEKTGERYDFFKN